MSRYSYVFADGGGLTIKEVASLVEKEIGAGFIPLENGDLGLTMRDGRVAIYLYEHPFEDDEDMDHDHPSFRAHPYVFLVKDLNKDYARQAEVADEIFEIISSEGRLPSFISDDLQDLVARFTPGSGTWRALGQATRAEAGCVGVEHPSVAEG